ncbi:MAG TPA: acetoacetyl-CoA reductase [Steroidobacteraceae bacterium]|nr:acetoacetyl-CoA reductase [Steroidobacteraceae bacterium]
MARIALVTGGVEGIGAATCRTLKQAGYQVAASFVEDVSAARSLREEYGIPTFQWNVADFDACHSGVAEVVRALGPVEVLVNNAGITRDASLHKMTPEQWRTVIEVNLGGCFNMCHAVIGSMRERRYGRIVNVSSVNGLAGQFGQTNYAASKAGIIGFTKALALESAAHGITVNAVAPGYTDTAMVAAVKADVRERIVAGVPLHRLARPEEVAAAIAFLVNDATAYITGETLSVNGGQYMH